MTLEHDVPTPEEALEANPDEPIEGADELPDEVRDGDVEPHKQEEEKPE